MTYKTGHLKVSIGDMETGMLEQKNKIKNTNMKLILIT